MIEVELYRKAFQDLQQMNEEVKQEVLTKIEKLENQGISIPEVSPWEDNNGELLFRLKIKEDWTDYRAFFDIEDGKAIIYGIFHRDKAYENSVKKELNDRVEE